MGVPAFFRWLSIRYPKVVVDALTEADIELLENEFKAQPIKQTEYNSTADQNIKNLNAAKATATIADKIAASNPTIDNLYLDMNGIIHPCAHPVNGAQPQSEAEIFDNIYAYTDKVIRLAAPKKLIYFAIDGVAPRAKMNQQRARRFRAAKDAEDDAIRKSELKAELLDQVEIRDKATVGSEFKFDSNVITPGTEFMYRLSIALKKYLVERANNDEDWQNLTLIFSDAFVPGEGEHKILDFIRSQRAQPGYDPNQRHCIYGADADLIMLGLSTHEPNFFVLREAVMQIKDRICFKCKEKGHMTYECGADYTKDKSRLSRAVEFQYVKISVVREYLELEFKDVQVPFQFDFERIVDDFVFLCFLVGNDFLPHLPSLQIRDGALDAILAIYKNLLPCLDGYLTKDGKINFNNVDVLFRDISKLEEEQFKTNYLKQLKLKQLEQKMATKERGQIQQKNDDDSDSDLNLMTQLAEAENTKRQARELLDRTDISKQEKAKLANELIDRVSKLRSETNLKTQVESYVDNVKLGVDGWKTRYYSSKFQVNSPTDVQEFTDKIKQSYIEGLQWVFAYYYKGCESWDWYYPFHYAPFASDLINCDRVKFDFEIGQPRRPFEQLMCVFPKQSAHALPACYRSLMSDSKSPIIDFYPINFKLDVNGAAYAWMGVNLLPFIDQDRLFKAMKTADNDHKKLSEIEKLRNKRTGVINVYFVKKEKSPLQSVNEGQEYEATYRAKDAIAGKLIKTNELTLGQDIHSTDRGDPITTVKQNKVIMMTYCHPRYPKHKSKILKGAVLPLKEVQPHEIFHIERRFFNGENAIQMAENVLGIDVKLKPIYTNTTDRNKGDQVLGKRPNQQSIKEFEPPSQMRNQITPKIPLGSRLGQVYKNASLQMPQQNSYSQFLGIQNQYTQRYYQGQNLPKEEEDEKQQFQPPQYNLHQQRMQLQAQQTPKQQSTDLRTQKK